MSENLLDLILPSDQDSFSAQNCVRQVASKELIKTLETIKGHLECCLRQCSEEIELAKVNFPSNNPDSFDKLFSAELAMTVLRLQNALYAYSEHAISEPEDVWRYIYKHREAHNADLDFGIRFAENKVVIHLPYLGHRSSSRASTSSKLLSAICFHEKEKFPNWFFWEATFYHVFPTSTKKIPRDVDNYNYKEVIDILAFSFKASDNAYHYSMNMKTVFTDQLLPGVYIEVVPKSSENPVLPEW